MVSLDRRVAGTQSRTRFNNRRQRKRRRRRVVIEALEDRHLLAAPVAFDDAHLVNADTLTPITGSLVANDVDADSGDTLSVDIVSGQPLITDTRLQELASRLQSPVSVTHAGDGSGRVFIVEQTGQIRVLRFGEPGPDQTAPNISSVYASTTPSGAAVTWQTDEPATGLIEYGLTSDYTQSTAASGISETLHRVIIGDLLPDTLYHYRVVTTDAAGNQTLSADKTFTTEAAEPSGELLYNGIVLPQQWPPQREVVQSPEVASYLISPPDVIDIDVGRQLFVDDFLIQETTLARTQHRPAFFEDNPILTTGGPDTDGFAMPFSDGVWFDPADGLFKLWYFGGDGNMLSYAHSVDGENWIKPQLANAVVADTNQVLRVVGRDSATVWMDLNDPDANRKFKLFVCAQPLRGPVELAGWHRLDRGCRGPAASIGPHHISSTTRFAMSGLAASAAARRFRWKTTASRIVRGRGITGNPMISSIGRRKNRTTVSGWDRMSMTRPTTNPSVLIPNCTTSMPSPTKVWWWDCSAGFTRASATTATTIPARF